MKTKKWRGFLLLLGFVFLFMVGCGAKTSNLPDKPERSVVDEAKVLSQDTLAYIDQVNRQLAQTSEQYQIGVYLPADLKGFSIEELANKVAKKWQVGFSGTNNGILLVVAPNDRKMRIETSNKAAEALPDVAAKRILDSAKSELKAKDYDRAVRLQIQGIIQYLGLSDSQLTQLGVTNSARAEHETALRWSNSPWRFVASAWPLFLILPFGIPLGIRLLRRRRGAFRWSDDDDDFFDGFWGSGGSGGILGGWWTSGSSGSGSSSSGSGSSGSSSGSSGGWGGGGFGGGGASSGW